MKIKDLKDFLDRPCHIDTAIVINVTEGKNAKGNKYLALTLQDSSGTVEAKKWEVNPGDEQLLGLKKVVSVDGYPLIYNNSQLQFKIVDVEPALNYSEEDLILSSPVDKKQLEERLFAYVDAIKDEEIKTIVEGVLNKHLAKLLNHPAAKTNHHQYAGGLLHHEVSMLDLASKICQLYPSINQDLLYGGIILHDLGKTEELSGPIATEYTIQGKLIGHISLVQTDIVEEGKKHNISDETILLLQHMVLSHHGK
ncbi:MAG: TraI domain-containing protein, partial [Erysipelotrichaceae bacterium]|nr:TraI domain-containing protein [Erysipelotrichaceae bacterium]